jgi:hypothetical protein
LRVNAWSDGYYPTQRSLVPLTGDRTENVLLAADRAACSAPGYLSKTIGIFQAFEAGGTLPAGWKIVDNASNGQVWTFNDPGLRGNLTGGSGGFAIVDSDRYGWLGHQDTELRTPALDFSGISQVFVAFDTDYFTFAGSSTDDIADVDVSRDDGQTWTTVWRKTSNSYRGPAHEQIDISALAAGRQKVIVRLHYHNAFWEWWWQVDNLLVGQDLGCQPQPGSLVVGNVYDDNTGEPLVGAQVSSDTGAVAAAKATPLDPRLDDGFYLLFSPSGSHTITASMGNGFEPDSQAVAVPAGSAIRQDFALRAGRLVYEPDRLLATLQLGQNTTLSLQIANQGRKALTYQVHEVEVGFEPEGPAQYAEVVIPGWTQSYGPDARVAKRRTVYHPEMRFVVRQVWRPNGAVKVLLLTPDVAAGGDIRVVQKTLAAFPDLEPSLWDAAQGTPSGKDLAAYDVVIVGNDYLWSSAKMPPEAVGDALADYLDTGGKVIETLFAHDYQGWQLTGRYVAEGYAPFTVSTRNRAATLSTMGRVYDPVHPILHGVQTIRDAPTTGISHQDVQVAPGVTRLADWDDGIVFVAYGENVVGVNQMWFHGANWAGDMPALMHNAILYLAAQDVDWLAALPSSGKIEPAGQQSLAVTMDAGTASVMQPGRYRALLMLANDAAYGNPAVPVTMTVQTGTVCSDVTGVELVLLNPDDVDTMTPAAFQVRLVPDGATPPFSYNIQYGDLAPPQRGSSEQKPFPLEHTYHKGGSYTAQVAVWNCRMPEAGAPTDTVLVQVAGIEHRSYLPIVRKNQ